MKTLFDIRASNAILDDNRLGTVYSSDLERLTKILIEETCWVIPYFQPSRHSHEQPGPGQS